MPPLKLRASAAAKLRPPILVVGIGVAPFKIQHGEFRARGNPRGRGFAGLNPLMSKILDKWYSLGF
jgi:hypothetical protein